MLLTVVSICSQELGYNTLEQATFAIKDKHDCLGAYSVDCDVSDNGANQQRIW